MSTKIDLENLNEKLGSIIDQINQISLEFPSIMISDDEGWNESFSAIAEAYDARIQVYRKKLKKLAAKLPKKGRTNIR